MWKRIEDHKVRHIWASSNPELLDDAVVNPDWYEENGTPVDWDGEDMVYVLTQIWVEEDKQ
jgi:hypothetical protein